MTQEQQHPQDADPSAAFDAEYWEDRYRRGEGASKHEPSPSLVTETDGLRPGRALDAGCGNGADALWLAARGWQVTAVDVSGTALERGRRSAEAVGADLARRVDWVRGDLTEWEPGERSFDLVTSHHVHVAGPAEELFARLARWVAPGGTLLVVGHDHAPHDRGSHDHGSSGRAPREHGGHAPARGSEISVAQVVDGLPCEEWEVVVAEPRTHTVRGPDGSPVVLHDVVVRARRTGPPGP